MIALLPVLVLVLLLAWEEHSRQMAYPAGSWRRQVANWTLGAANWAIAALVPIGAIIGATFSGTGLLANLPLAAALALLIPARTLANYWLHRLAHRWPLLWSIHRLHHGDQAMDISTGLRSHPAEALLSAALAAIVALALGPSVQQVVACDAVLFSAVLWHHAAVRLPLRWNEGIERIIVTPRFHLLHHSVDPADHDSNYGDFFTVWDRIFGSFAAPSDRAVKVGLSQPSNRMEAEIRSARQTAR